MKVDFIIFIPQRKEWQLQEMDIKMQYTFLGLYSNSNFITSNNTYVGNSTVGYG
jgi:hypothetical protein